MGRVIVVGSVNVDLVVTSERLPGPGETVAGGRFAQHHGGKGGNQAVAAARLGATTAFVGAVGDDAFGVQARAALAAEGIDLTQLRTLAGEATGVALILVDGAGENSISVASGANAALTPDARANGRWRHSWRAPGTWCWSATRSRRRRARGAGAGSRRRSDDDPQPGPGDRHHLRHARCGGCGGSE